VHIDRVIVGDPVIGIVQLCFRGFGCGHRATFHFLSGSISFLCDHYALIRSRTVMLFYNASLISQSKTKTIVEYKVVTAQVAKAIPIELIHIFQ
jgi:hypothetical protein